MAWVAGLGRTLALSASLSRRTGLPSSRRMPHARCEPGQPLEVGAQRCPFSTSGSLSSMLFVTGKDSAARARVPLELEGCIESLPRAATCGLVPKTANAVAYLFGTDERRYGILRKNYEFNYERIQKTFQN